MTDTATDWPSAQQIDAWRARIRQDVETNYLYCMGVALAGEGAASQAETILRRAVELDPRFAGARHALADLLRSAGRSEEAAALERQGRDLNVDFEHRALLDRIEHLQPAQDEDVAPLLPALRAATVQATPEAQARARTQLHDMLGLLAQRAEVQGNDEACAAALTEMIPLAEDAEHRVDDLRRLTVLRWKAGALDEAISIIRQAWALARGSRQESAIGLQAITILRCNLHLAEAQAICGALLAHQPADAKHLIHQGLLQTAMGDHGAAVSTLTMATQHHPTLADAWMFLSAAQAAAGNVPAAVAAGRKAVECQAADLPLRTLALALALSGDGAAAVAAASQARGLNEPATAWGLILEAITQWRLGDTAARATAAASITIPYPRGPGRHIWFLVRLHPYAADFLGGVYGELGLMPPAAS